MMTHGWTTHKKVGMKKKGGKMVPRLCAQDTKSVEDTPGIYDSVLRTKSMKAKGSAFLQKMKGGKMVPKKVCPKKVCQHKTV